MSGLIMLSSHVARYKNFSIARVVGLVRFLRSSVVRGSYRVYQLGTDAPVAVENFIKGFLQYQFVFRARR